MALLCYAPTSSFYPLSRHNCCVLKPFINPSYLLESDTYTVDLCQPTNSNAMLPIRFIKSFPWPFLSCVTGDQHKRSSVVSNSQLPLRPVGAVKFRCRRVFRPRRNFFHFLKDVLPAVPGSESLHLSNVGFDSHVIYCQCLYCHTYFVRWNPVTCPKRWAHHLL